MTLRLLKTSVVAVLAILISSCSSEAAREAARKEKEEAERFAKSKDATLTCWNQFIEVGKSAQTKLGPSPSLADIAAAYDTSGDRLAALPTLNVDPELVELIHRFSREFNELAPVCRRLSLRREDIGYGVGKLLESFIRGVMMDPFGTTKEMMEEDKQDKVKLDQIQERLRKNVADMATLRAKLTSKYGLQLPPVD